MACLKCGNKTRDEQVFCAHCLSVMEQYPVKKELHVQLPNRPGDDYKIVRKRRPPTLEEQIETLRKKNRRMKVWFALLILLFGAASFLTFRMRDRTPEDLNWGQNYSTEESAG